MANAFNLTAQINLRGPANIKTVVADIRRQLGTINTDINLKVNPQAARSIDTVRTRLDAMNNSLIQARQNTDQLNTALQSLSSSLGNIQNISGRTASAVSKTSSSANSAAKNIKVATTEMEEFGKQSALAVRRFAAFSVVTTGIFSLINAVNSGFKAFVEFDKELIRLQQVTGKGALGLKSLEKEITNLAVSLGVSSTSLTTVATTLAQAGLSAEETRIALAALAKTELAPSFDNLVDTTEGAIAAIRQFGLEAGQLESALGSINAVAAAFAVESGDIIAAIQRTGGVFAAASKGVSEGTDALNEFISIFTSVRQTTRESAETIATGLRTIFTRIQRAQTIDQLRDFGVELTDLEGKFVGPFEAIRRLSDALNQLDPRDLRFSKIVEELGGFRQIGKVIPLIQQFAVAQTALKVAQQGQSSLVDAQITAQQSLANQLTKVREQFLALVRDIGQSQTFQSLFKIVTGLTSGLISLAGAFKPILPILAVFGLAKGLKAATQFTTGFVGNIRKGGGAQAVGQNLGDTVTGQNQRATAEATNQASRSITENTSAVRTLTDAMNNLRTTANDVANVIVNSTNALANVIVNNRPGGSTGLNSGGIVRKFARGGMVPGSGNTDSVPAMLQPGEFVIRKKAVETLGAQNLHRMNKYASGGMATKPRSAPFSTTPLIDDIVENSSDAIRPSKIALERILQIGYGALDFDRTLKRTTGDAAYSKAKTKEQKDAVLSRYFRDAENRLSDAKSARLTQFGTMLQEAIKKRMVNPNNLSIISKSVRVPGLAEHINELFGIPLENMEFTAGGDKSPVLEDIRSRGPMVSRMLKSMSGSVARFANGGAVSLLDSLKKKGGVGVAILDGPQNGDPSGSTDISVSDILSDFSKAPDKKSSIASMLKGIKSIQLLREGVGTQQLNTFKEALKQGLAGGVNTAGAILAKEYDLPAPLIDNPNIDNFIKGLNDAAIGNLFEDVLTAIENNGVYDSDINPRRPFDFTKGFTSAGNKKLFPRLSQSGFDFIDAKSSLDSAAPAGIRNKIVNQLFQDAGLFQNAAQSSIQDKLIEGLKRMRTSGLAEFKTYQLADMSGLKSEQIKIKELESQGLIKKVGSGRYKIADTQNFMNGGMAQPKYTWAEDKAFYDSTNSKRTWYNVFQHGSEGGAKVIYSGSFDDVFKFLEQKRKEQSITKKMASGGLNEDTVPAMLTPGEFVINKKAAKTIGYSRLHKLNKADKMQGFNKGGLVGGLQSFATGGTVTNPEEDAFIAYKARQSNMGDRQYRLSLASKVADAQVNMGRDFQGRQEEFRYGLVNDQARLKGIDRNTDVGQNQLEQAITEMANRIQAFDPTMDFDKAREAASQLADGLINSNVDQLDDVMNKADKLGDIFKELSDEGARAEKAFASVARQENIDVSILKNQVNNREIDRQKFIRSPEGQRFGKLAEIAPDFIQRFAGSKFGGALGAGADFVSGRGGRISKLFAGAGGFTGIGAGVAVAADQARQFLPTSLKSNANVAGALGAIGGAGSGAASGALLGTQIAGPVGTLIGGIGGAIIGGIDGWFAGKNQQALSNSLDQITKSSSDLDMAFKKLDQNASKINFDNAQKAFGKVLSDTDQLNSIAFGERSTVGSMAGSGAIGAAGGAVAGAALGSVVPILGTALGAAAGAAIGGIAGAYADYRSRPTTAERREALQTRIGMSTQNQQSATRLFETDLSKMSTASIDKTIKDLQNGTTTLSPIAEQYAKSSIAAAGGTEALTQSQIEQIRVRAEESAALDAFSAAMKQAGMTDEKVAETIEKNRSEALNKGREISKEQSILAAKSALLARVTRDLAVATEQTLDIYRRAIAGVQRYSQELESFQVNVLNRSGDLTGKAKVGRVDRTNERILSNISAFSLDEVRDAARQTGGIAGGGAAGSKLERDILAAKVLRDELPKAIKEANSRGGDASDIIDILKKSFANAGVVFSDELQAQIQSGIEEKTIASDQNVGLGDITDPAIIDGLLKGPEEALKFAAELQSKYNDTLETANTLLAEFNELTNEAAEWQRKAANIRYSAELELARALGNSPTLAQLNKPIDDNIRSITAQNGLIPGGSNDPQAIFNAMQRGRANADMLQERINNTRSQIGLPGVDNNALNQNIEDQTRALNKQKAALNDGNRALKQLAEDGSKAANALSKIQDRRQQAQAVSDLARRVLTSDNDELNQLNKGLSAYTKTISGRATSGDMANLDFRRQAFEGLDSISSILPAGVAQKMQARLSRTMLESTADGRRALDRVITQDADGNDMTLRDALQNAESGIDPQQQKYIDAYRAATEVQARAAELLAQNALLAAEQLNMDIKELFAGIETKLAQILERAMGEAGGRQAENQPKGGGAFNVQDDTSRPVQRPATVVGTGSSQRPLNWSAVSVPSQSAPPTANHYANFTNMTGSSMVTQPANVPQSGGRRAVQNAQGQFVDPVFGLPVVSPSLRRNTTPLTTRQDMTNAAMASPQTQPVLSPYQQMMKNRRDAYEQEMERRRNNFRASRGLPPTRAPSRNSGPVPVNITQPSQPAATTQTNNNNGIQQNNNTQPSIMIDENSRQFMEAFSTSLKNFGSYVEKLAEIRIPEKIEMTGTHVVDVRISGAAAFEGLKKDFNEMIVSEVSKEMNKIWVQSGGKLGNRPK